MLVIFCSNTPYNGKIRCFRLIFQVFPILGLKVKKNNKKSVISGKNLIFHTFQRLSLNTLHHIGNQSNYNRILIPFLAFSKFNPSFWGKNVNF